MHDRVPRGRELQGACVCLRSDPPIPQICATKTIELHVHSPAVSSIDLLDLPGLKTNPGPEDAPDMPQQVDTLVRSQIELHKDSAVFLVTTQAKTEASECLGMKLVTEYGLQARTIGVITKCDDVGRPTMRALPARLQQTDSGTRIQPHGYVATMMAPLEDPPEGTRHFDQLQTLARDELNYFEGQRVLQPMVGLGLATCNTVRRMPVDGVGSGGGCADLRLACWDPTCGASRSALTPPYPKPSAAAH